MTLGRILYADPPICPACGGRMRIIPFLDDLSTLEEQMELAQAMN